ncbi:MAG: collagen-like protein, partial [Clostridia bacterium]|nr:collagen-like protein [Clostridia bacterium]
NPSNPTYPQVEFEIISSTAAGAEINGKFLTAKSVGQINLRAWVDGVASKEFEIFVDKEPVTDVKFTSTKKSFKHTESLVLEAMAFPVQATFKDIEFVVDESLTDKQIGAKIEGNILTAELPGTVIVSMKCDGRVYPVVIAVEKEPVIAISALETKLLTANAKETVFRTSGVLELSALLYPDNATNQTLKISIPKDNSAGAVLWEKFNGFDGLNKLDSSYEVTVNAGKKVYLTANKPESITVTVTSLDNENIEMKYVIDVMEEPVADIYFCLDSTAGYNAESLMKEDVNVLQNFNDYYQYDQMFVMANQIGSRSSSLNFSVVTYAQNRDLTPTYDGQYKLYYYKDYNECLNRRNGTDLTGILSAEELAGNNDYIVRTGLNSLSMGTRKRVIWITAESVSKDNNSKVVSQPLKLTIYPTNIADIKTLQFNDKTGILSSGTKEIKDMSGYEVSVKFKVKGKDYGFTQYIPTTNTKLGLKLFRYGATPFDVSVKMIFDADNKEERFEYQVPIGKFNGITGLVPKKQLQQGFGEFDCNYVVFYDLFISSMTFDINKTFLSNVKYVYIYGNSNMTHRNLDFSFFNGDSPIGITLHDINFIANGGCEAIAIYGTGLLNLNVVGDKVSVQGSQGANGAKGRNGLPFIVKKAENGKNGLNGDANWNPAGGIPHGQPGEKGTDGLKGSSGGDGGDGYAGLNGIKLAIDNNIELKVSCSDFKIIGGKGGNGGDGGDGCDGQEGGDGGHGGNGSYKYIVVGWRAGH